MYGFHSDEGMEMIKRLPKAKTIPEGVKDVSQTTRNFREWRAQLVKDGWFVSPRVGARALPANDERLWEGAG
jgi:hypothetical protein